MLATKKGLLAWPPAKGVNGRAVRDCKAIAQYLFSAKRHVLMDGVIHLFAFAR
jgi:hypothetical protein